MLNAADYPDLQPSTDVKLSALGFDSAGHRGGGILQPRVVTLPKGAVLLRLHKPVESAGEREGDFGQWCTPYEYRRLGDRFGVDGQALVPGRSVGKSALHGAFALMHEWYDNSPNQLTYLNVVRMKEPLFACYGSGAPGNSDGYTRTLKPIVMQDRQTARQVYIHKCWEYQYALQRLVVPNASTDDVLGSESPLPRPFMSAPRLGFES